MDGNVPVNRDLVDLLDGLAAAKHNDLSVAADAAQEIRRLRAIIMQAAAKLQIIEESIDHHIERLAELKAKSSV